MLCPRHLQRRSRPLLRLYVWYWMSSSSRWNFTEVITLWLREVAALNSENFYRIFCPHVKDCFAVGSYFYLRLLRETSLRNQHIFECVPHRFFRILMLRSHVPERPLRISRNSSRYHIFHLSWYNRSRFTVSFTINIASSLIGFLFDPVNSQLGDVQTSPFALLRSVSSILLPRCSTLVDVIAKETQQSQKYFTQILIQFRWIWTPLRTTCKIKF